MKLWPQRRKLTVSVTDTTNDWRPLSPRPDDRPWYDVQSNLRLAKTMFRTNPMAARIVAMKTDFALGSGVELDADPWTTSFWNHPKNRLDTRLYRWSDELTRSGELFIVLFPNPVDRMQYLREIPAHTIDRVDTDPDDVESEISYHQTTAEPDGATWKSAAIADPTEPCVLHFAINKPIGETRGYSDLYQISKWLDRYDQWLEDRVRINRYKGAYLWHVKLDKALPAQLELKRAQYSRPPSPGSVIISDASETWTAIRPEIGADDAEPDGKALRLMIAAGTGVPLHFLGEGESATRATAREMGTATFRHFSARQQTLRVILSTVIDTAAHRANKTPAYTLHFEPVTQEDERNSESEDPAIEQPAD